MANRNRADSYELSDTHSSNTLGNVRSSTSRRIPKSWIIAAVLFYIASVVTVGLLSGLLPKRIQHITYIGTPTADTSSTTATPLPCINDECNPRLQSNIEVYRYTIEYFYNKIEQTTIQGQVTIEFELKQSIQQLIYHGKRFINLEEPLLLEDNVTHLVSMKLYPPNDYIVLQSTTNELFPENTYILTQKFTVDLADGNVGFYQNIYKDGNETNQKLLATKFQPTDARKAFPCFDEPHLKARFKISIHHPENTIALANFPTSLVVTDDNSIYTTFEETFPMSTYLAAWAVVPTNYGQKTDASNLMNVTVWARSEPTNNNQTAFALEVALNSLPFFKDYFNTSEPIPPKNDLLSVPDFSSGAMENWGLVSFREDRIIFDDKIASTYQKQRLAETMSHELAHFWFGNYVTCKWWDDLWLNEAMATWLSFKPFSVHYPDWNMALQALTEDVIPVMWDDAKPSSHPIVVQNVSTASAITSLFDSITYSKGASILRMLEKIAGPDRFQQGLRDYLRENAFSVGDPTSFYKALFTDRDGAEFVQNWLEEQNYPLLTVKLSIENESTVINFNQSRFIISDVLDPSGLDPNYRWKIPVQCILGGESQDNEVFSLTLSEEYGEKVISDRSTFSWIKCNRYFQGFFVTEYHLPSDWLPFSAIITNRPEFTDEDKVNLLQDAFLLAYKGLFDYKETLGILKSLVNSKMDQYVFWRTFEWHWENLGTIVDYLPDTIERFRQFAIDQILSGTTLNEILTINSNDNHNTKLVKSLKYSLLCRMHHAEALSRATAFFQSIPCDYFVHNNRSTMTVNADFLSTVYKYHIQTSDNQNDWNLLYNYYRTAVSPQEQTRALVAISSISNAELLTQLLNEGLSGRSNTIKRQDYFAMMAYISQHSIGRDTVWKFYQENYSKLVDTFTLENRRFGTAILSIARSFQTETYLNQMRQLFSKYPNAGAGALARKQALDQVNMNIEWIRSREANLRDALQL